eukprot:4300767-Pleurochrysis_carterae.AAC.2
MHYAGTYCCSKDSFDCVLHIYQMFFFCWRLTFAIKRMNAGVAFCLFDIKRLLWRNASAAHIHSASASIGKPDARTTAFIPCKRTDDASATALPMLHTVVARVAVGRRELFAEARRRLRTQVGQARRQRRVTRHACLRRPLHLCSSCAATAPRRAPPPSVLVSLNSKSFQSRRFHVDFGTCADSEASTSRRNDVISPTIIGAFDFGTASILPN